MSAAFGLVSLRWVLGLGHGAVPGWTACALIGPDRDMQQRGDADMSGLKGVPVGELGRWRLTSQDSALDSLATI